jgi:uncharacterized membrane protein
MLPQIQTFLAAMTPIGELRLAIPLGISVYELPWYEAFLWAVAGNMVPVFFLLLLLERISRFLLSFPNPLGRFLRWRTERLRLKHSAKFQRYGAFALLFFVAIPLPFTGAWTGSLVAVAFDIYWQRAFPIIGLGVIIAGIIVTSATLGTVNWLPAWVGSR